ncbi:MULTISPECIES: ABC transporter ATP-binding protein [Niallia]|uniref:ABC transporter ATP-binding protein n=1 Tax=Niallia circulans TaxID=1397 RepID=A0A941JKZ8_NIACI|nr:MULTISPECIES: ABC transporter ATP-binding protein [Niallia]EOR23111.1 oligopeptide ABC transporter ATP-binding protein [Niallia nealsonii AAU1]MCB5239805.1 ABC transporter ATP-binding protein [Niallia circulans]UTI42776.1 ABC transporter ATP-binding protein [Niallia sp. RD1]
MSSDTLLDVKDLKTHFFTERGKVTAIDGVSFQINKGEIVGVVGESGCGKSVTSQSVLRLFDEKHLVKYEGEILFEGETDLLKLSKKKMQMIRGNDISMIFQDPLSSLNPVLTIGFQIAEAIMLHQDVTKKEAYERAVEMLKLTGIPSPEKRVNDYPHNLSGGMRQRVMIAMTLACQPKLLIADEPTTALDVTIQAQILDLISELNQKLEMGVMFITHDLGVVAELCHRVVVMYLGQIVEEASVESLFESPLHPYTKGLIKSIPQMEGDRSQKLHVIEGTVPSLDSIPIGCRFAPRCPFADSVCLEKAPDLTETSSNQKVRCWHFEKIAQEEECYANVSS